MKRMVPAAEIKWIRLQNICEAIVDRKKTVHIHGSTDVPENLRAAVEQRGDRVDIVMNLLYNKDLADVIRSLAHEMTHIVLQAGNGAHGLRFNRKWRSLGREMTVLYNLKDQVQLGGKVDKGIPHGM